MNRYEFFRCLESGQDFPPFLIGSKLTLNEAFTQTVAAPVIQRLTQQQVVDDADKMDFFFDFFPILSNVDSIDSVEITENFLMWVTLRFHALILKRIGVALGRKLRSFRCHSPNLCPDPEGYCELFTSCPSLEYLDIDVGDVPNHDVLLKILTELGGLTSLNELRLKAYLQHISDPEIYDTLNEQLYNLPITSLFLAPRTHSEAPFPNVATWKNLNKLSHLHLHLGLQADTELSINDLYSGFHNHTDTFLSININVYKVIELEPLIRLLQENLHISVSIQFMFSNPSTKAWSNSDSLQLLQMYSLLNESGRKVLLDENASRERAYRVLERVSTNASAVFEALRMRPHLCNRVQNIK